MRRLALLGLLVLPGCQFAADPTVGFGGFIADTHTWHLNANRPPAVTENEKLAVGEPVAIEPLLPEGGEVWPGPPPKIPTLQDVQSLTNMEQLPPANIPTAPPPSVFPENNAPASAPVPQKSP